ncbi:MAG: hypothetical protein R3290_03920 [Acidimicrobiia bacterium]|nr:hypothetical protein [Acidimicrobiia bacterium]
MNTVRTRLRRLAPSGEAGITIAEVIVALFVVVVVFFGFTQAMTGAVNGSRGNLLAQHGTDIALEQVELARAVGWDGFALSGLDPDAPLLTGSGDALDGDAVGLPTNEPLVVDGEEGAIAPKSVVNRRDTDFTVWSYVTEAGDLRRLVVQVRWVVESGERTFETSTLVGEESWG